MFFCADFHCSSCYLSQAINWFCSFALCFAHLNYILGKTPFFYFWLSAAIFLEVLFVSSQLLCGFLCDINIFLVTVSSLLILPLANSSESCKAFNFKMLICADSHFFKSPFPSDKLILLLWIKYNMIIQHDNNNKN